jgi:DNA (cytosine-5)-methyltransferase 1
LKISGSWVIEEKVLQEFMVTSTYGVAENQPSYVSERERQQQPIALSFFSGAMGMDIGIEKAGFKTLLASEIDKASRKTILRNHPDIALIGDIRDYTPDEVRTTAGLSVNDPIDLIVGGPPCQAFSTAGRRKGFEDERGNVFLTFIDMITALRPRFAVIENVRGLLSAPLKHRPHQLRGSGHPELSMEELPGGALNHIITILEEHGYAVSFNLYNSANFGTPQTRERVIIICSRDGKKMPYLEPTHAPNGEFDLPAWRTFSKAMENSNFEEHHHLEFPEKRLRFYRHIKAGQNWKSLPIDMQKEAMGASFYAGGGKTGFFRRIAWDKPSPTLLTHPAMPATDLGHPVEDRPLSVEEYKVLQEFPEYWKIEGSLVEQYRQLGNAVPVGLGYAVGKLLMKKIDGKEIKDYKGFRHSRYRNTDDKSWRIKIKTSSSSFLSHKSEITRLTSVSPLL